MTEGEWQGAMHWKTWVLAGLDICISTIKCARAPKLGQDPSPTSTVEGQQSG